MNYKMKNEALTVCEVKINYLPKVKPSERPKISGPASIYSLLMGNGIFDLSSIEHREFFKILLLNNANKLLGITHLSEGSINGVVVDIRYIIQVAILSNATGIILCHNHPSGNLQPSSQDDTVTGKVQAACKLFDIKLLDHLVISSESYYSYANEGRIL
jgi:DNA repair protein RadC